MMVLKVLMMVLMMVLKVLIDVFCVQLSSHQHDCPKAQVSCQFLRYGCSFKVTDPPPEVL